MKSRSQGPWKSLQAWRIWHRVPDTKQHHEGRFPSTAVFISSLTCKKLCTALKQEGKIIFVQLLSVGCWGNPRANKWWYRISACEIQISHTAWCLDFPRPVPDNSIWEGTKHPNTSKFTLLYLVPTYQQAAYKFLKLNLTNCLHYVTYLSECCSGKSIAIALLRRFYDPDAGHILLDRVDIQKFQLRWLSQQLYVKNHLCSITRSRQTSPTERKGKRQTPMLWLLHDWQMLTSSSVHCIR